MYASISTSRTQRRGARQWSTLLGLVTILLFAMPLRAGFLDNEILTYQGRLLDNNAPVTGTVDMNFELWTSESGGSMVTSHSISGVTVSSGLFQVDLPFGSQPYEDGLWLEIEADGTTLTPRQRLAPVPLAMHALNSGDEFWQLSGGVPGYDGAVGIETDEDADALVASNLSEFGTAIRAEGSTGIYVDGDSTGVIASGGSLGVFGSSGDTAIWGYTNNADGFGGRFEGVEGSSSFFGHPVGIMASETQATHPQATLEINGPGVGGNNRALQVSVNDDEKLFVSGLGTSILQPLFVEGTVSIASFATGGGVDVCRTGSIGFTGTLAECSSSARYKSEIATLESTMALVERLRPVSFRWTESGGEDVGLVAEEVAEIDPRLVTYNGNGQVEGVKYRQLNALLIRALQEQGRDIERMRGEVETLTHQLEQSVDAAQRNRQLSRRMDRLEAVLLDRQQTAGKN